jgi:serine/threonine-protein kinase
VTSKSENLSAREQLLHEVIADYLAGEEAGLPQIREQVLARYPDLADDLRAFFARHDQWRREADPGCGVHANGDLPGAAERPGGSLEPVRYFGDYELHAELGRGGMGIVYRARQVSLNRPVALKMIIEGQLATRDDIGRFYAEAENVARLDHPNIVPIYEVGEHQGEHFFSMKLIEGDSLAEKLAPGNLPAYPRQRAVSATSAKAAQRRAASLVAKAAQAVHYAHLRGIFHRDLKPGNILLDNKGEPYIADFGLARRTATNAGFSTPGAVAGTPEYMAPEQAAGTRDLTSAVDVYGLGAVLYALLTGQPPFQGATPLDTLLQVKEQEPKSPRTVNRRVDRELAVICLKCLEKDPERRYRSAEALAQDLGRWLDGKPISARPIGPVARLWRLCRRKPVVTALATTSVCLATVLTALVVVAKAEQGRKDARDEQALNAAVDRASHASARGRHATAHDELKHAEELAQQSTESLHRRFESRLAGLKVQIKLDAIRLRGIPLHEPSSRALQASRAQHYAIDAEPPAVSYARVFREYGIDVANLDVTKAASLVRESDIRDALVVALDDWAQRTPPGDPGHRQHVYAVAGAADRHPVALAGRLRTAFAKGDRNALLALADEAKALLQSPDEEVPSSVLVALAAGLRRDGHLVQAVAILEAALRRHPDDVWLNLDMGITLILANSSEPRDGLPFLTAAYALSGGNPIVYLYPADVLSQANRPLQALTIYDLVLKLSPRDPDSWNGRGIALTQRQRYDEALKAFDEASRLKPNHARAHFNRGYVLDLQERFAEAIDSYRNALKHKPEYAEARYNLGYDLLYHKGKFAEAAAELTRGLEHVADTDPKRKDWQRFLDECRRCLKLEPRLGEVVNGAKPADAREACQLAVVCAYQQRFGWAADLYEQAFALDPARAENLHDGYRYFAATCAARMGCGRGDAAEGAQAPRQTHWRGLALTWLRADLKLRQKQIDSGTAEQAKEARTKLRYWQTDRSLACVRQDQAIAGLPAGERDDWRRLWEAVARRCR